MADHLKIPALDTVPTYTVGATPQSVFDIPFPFWQSADIEVIVGPLEDVLAPSEYSVAGIMEQDGDDIVGAYGRGTLTLDTAVTNTTVKVDRLIVAERLTDFSNAAPLHPNTLNSELDKVTAREQDLKRRLLQALEDLETVRTILAELELARLAALDDITDATGDALNIVEASVQVFIQANLNFHDRLLAFNEAATDVGAQLTYNRMGRWERTYRALIDADFFSWGVGGLMIGESKEQTLLNFVDPALVMTETGGTLRFLKDRYIGGSDPALAYIATGYTLPQAGFLQDSASLWVRPVEDIGDDERVIGTSGGKSFIAPTTDQNHVRLRLNSLANIDSTRFTPNGAGDWALIRPDASTIHLYRGDDLYETFTDTSQTVAGGGNQIIILGAGALRTTGRIAYAVWGLEATAAQYTAARAILEEHAREIGAVP